MECFAVYVDEIEGRIDPYYYKPDFVELEKKVLKKTNKQLGDFIETLSSGATPSRKMDDTLYTDEKEGIPFLRVQNISENGLNLEDVKFITKNVHNNSLKRSQVSEDNLLITITGRIASSCVVPKGFVGNINQHSVVIKTKNRKMSELIASFLNSDIGYKLALRRTSGGSRPALDYTALKSIPIVFKPEIVSIMDNAYKIKKQKENEAQQLLDSFEELLRDEKVLDLKKITRKKMFSINLNDLDGAFNPERYANQIQFDRVVDWIKINNIGQIYRDTFTPEKTNPENIYSLMRIDDLANNPISAVTRNVKGKDVNGTILKVQTNDVLIARLGPTIENRKFVLAPKSNIELISSNEFICLRCNEINNPYFALHLLKTDFYKNLMIQKTRGATPSRMRLSHEDFSELPFPKIDIEIQSKIAEEVKRRMQKAERLQKEAKQLMQEVKEKVEKIILENRN